MTLFNEFVNPEQVMTGLCIVMTLVNGLAPKKLLKYMHIKSLFHVYEIKKFFLIFTVLKSQYLWI